MGRHRIYLEADLGTPGDPLEISGEEAHHAARVKRLAAGDRVEILNGRGLVALAEVTEIAKAGKGDWRLRCTLESIATEPPTSPAVHVLAAAPKGPRLAEMIDQLSQAGAAGWAPLTTARTVVSPREGKLHKAERTAAESAKQCARAWVMAIEPTVSLKSLLAAPPARLVVADASGQPYSHDGSPEVTLLVGPEGGFTDEEVALARDAGATVCSFGRHVMRVETAAVVATALILDAAARYNDQQRRQAT